ncbi:MAG: hypothetical protein R3A79_08420 [Nannocystaceae bacterium]
MTDPVAVALFAAALLGLALAALVLDRDLWPFAPYSMFSRRHSPAEIHVFRLLFVCRDGARAFWSPRFRYEARYLSGEVAAIASDPTLDPATRRTALIALTLRAFAYALREDPGLDAAAIAELVLVHREIDDAPELRSRDAPLLRLPLAPASQEDPP